MTTRLRKDEQGIAHLIYIVLAVIVVAAIAFAAWRILDKNKTTTSSTNGSTTTSSTASSSGVSTSCLAIYHDSNLCHFSAFSTDFDKTAYTAQIITTQNGTKDTLNLENDGKGNNELTSTGGGQKLNSITLDGNTYVQDNGSGPWIEYSSGSTAPTSSPITNMNIAVGSSGIDFKADGTTSCGSLTCFKYQVTDSSSPNTTQYVYFDNSSYKLREWQYTDASGNTTDMTITYGSVNITKPSPVESVSTVQ